MARQSAGRATDPESDLTSDTGGASTETGGGVGKGEGVGGADNGGGAADATTRVLDAADRLFYAHGIRAVGMDRIRDAAGVPLKRLYQCFPSKAALVDAYLRRRDVSARQSMAAYVASRPTPEARLLAVFDWLYEVFREPGFRGCALTNAFGELGPDVPDVARVVHEHKSSVRESLRQLARATAVPDPDALAAQLVVLFDGAVITAAVTGSPDAARHARAAVEVLLRAAGRDASAAG